MGKKDYYPVRRAYWGLYSDAEFDPHPHLWDFYRAEDDTVPIKPDHKMSKEQIMKEYTANGFKLVESFDDPPWQHLMFFEVADAPEDGATKKE